MGFRFRKSKNLGPFRVTVSKSGVSTSFGGKGARITKTASGKVRTTLSVPGTGISYVTESGGGKKQKAKEAKQGRTAGRIRGSGPESSPRRGRALPAAGRSDCCGRVRPLLPLCSAGPCHFGLRGLRYCEGPSYRRQGEPEAPGSSAPGGSGAGAG